MELHRDAALHALCALLVERAPALGLDAEAARVRAEGAAMLARRLMDIDCLRRKYWAAQVASASA